MHLMVMNAFHVFRARSMSVVPPPAVAVCSWSAHATTATVRSCHPPALVSVRVVRVVLCCVNRAQKEAALKQMAPEEKTRSLFDDYMASRRSVL